MAATLLLFLIDLASLAGGSMLVARRWVPGAGRLERAASAAVVGLYAATVLLMVLGMARCLRPLPTTLGCLLFALGALLIAGRRPEPEPVAAPAAQPGPRWWAYTPLALPIALFAPLLARSMAAPPLAWDGLTYHLPRAADWVRAGALVSHGAPDAWRYYDFFPPGGDLLFAFTFLAGHGDTLLFVVHVAVMAGLLLGTFALARALGAQESGASVAAAIVATTPAVLQYTAVAYVDSLLLAALLLACAHVARPVASGRAGPALILAAAAAGAAAVIKTSGLPVVLVVLGLAGVQALQRRLRWVELALLSSLAVLPAGLWSIHTLLATGSPVYPMPLRLGPVAVAGNELLARTLDGSLLSVNASDQASLLGKLLVWQLPDSPSVNFGPGAVLLVPLAILGVIHARRSVAMPVLIALLVIAVVPVLGLLGPGMLAMRTLFAFSTPRLMSVLIAIGACLAVLPPGRLSRIGPLLWLAGIAPVAALGAPSLLQLRPAAAAVGIGALLLAGWLAAGVAPISLRLRWLGVLLLGPATLLGVGIMERSRHGARHAFYEQLGGNRFFELHPVPSRDQFRAWRYLDQDRPLRIAYAARFIDYGQEIFTYPLYGARLQNWVGYVSPLPGAAIRDRWRPGAGSEVTLGADAYAGRLLRSADFVMLVGRPWPEDGWVRSRPDRFERILEAADGSWILIRPRPGPASQGSGTGGAPSGVADDRGRT